MIEIRFDGETGRYERKASNLDSVIVLSEMTVLDIGMMNDIRKNIGPDEAKMFVDEFLRYAEKSDVRTDKGKGLIQ